MIIVTLILVVIFWFIYVKHTKYKIKPDLSRADKFTLRD